MARRSEPFEDPVADPLHGLLDVIEQSVRRVFVQAKVTRPEPYPIAVGRREAARLMSVSVATVDQWIRSGRVHMVETDNRRAVIATWSLFELAGINPVPPTGLFVLEDTNQDLDRSSNPEQEDPPAA